jgi:hypothetical protein
MLWLIAQSRHQQDLKAAERRRMVQWLRQQSPPQPILWQRLAWRVGDRLVRAGERLKAGYQTDLPTCYQQSEPIL